MKKITVTDSKKLEDLRRQVSQLLEDNKIDNVGALWIFCDGLMQSFPSTFDGCDKKFFLDFMSEVVWDGWKESAEKALKQS